MATITGWEIAESVSGFQRDMSSGPTTDISGPGSRSWRDLAQNRPDPLMQFDWDVLFKPPAGANAIGAEYVEEIHVPMPKFDSDSVTYQARKYYYAKFEEFGVATVKLYEDRRMNATRFVRAWQSRIKDNQGNYRVPKAYKGSIIVWPQDSMQTNIAKMELLGVFPTVIPTLNFTSSNERVVLEVEFSVDRVKIDFS